MTLLGFALLAPAVCAETLVFSGQPTRSNAFYSTQDLSNNIIHVQTAPATVPRNSSSGLSVWGGFTGGGHNPVFDDGLCAVSGNRIEFSLPPETEADYHVSLIGGYAPIAAKNSWQDQSLQVNRNTVNAAGSLSNALLNQVTGAKVDFTVNDLSGGRIGNISVSDNTAQLKNVSGVDRVTGGRTDIIFSKNGSDSGVQFESIQMNHNAVELENLTGTAAVTDITGGALRYWPGVSLTNPLLRIRFGTVQADSNSISANTISNVRLTGGSVDMKIPGVLGRLSADQNQIAVSKLSAASVVGGQVCVFRNQVRDDYVVSTSRNRLSLSCVSTLESEDASAGLNRFIAGGAIHAYDFSRGSGIYYATDNAVDLTGGDFDGSVYGASLSIESLAGVTTKVRSVDGSGNAVRMDGFHLLGQAALSAGYLHAAASAKDTLILSEVRMNDNILVLHDSQVQGTVAVARFDSNALIKPGHLQMDNNRLILSGNSEVSSVIAGAVRSETPGRYVAAGRNNTLEVQNYSGGGVGDIVGFQTIAFSIQADKAVNGATILAVTSGTQTKLDDVTIQIDLVQGSRLGKNDVIHLMDGLSAENGTIANQGELVNVHSGIASLYSLRIDQTDHSVDLTYVDSGIHPGTGILTEGRLATVPMIVSASDFIVEKGADTAIAQSCGQDGLSAFTGFKGFSDRYAMGDRMKVNAENFFMGLGSKRTTAGARTLIGAFMEAGYGSLRLRETLGGTAQFADGTMDYLGLGVLYRHELDSGFYSEGSMRLGRLAEDVTTSLNNGSDHAQIDKSTGYFGAHLGAGVRGWTHSGAKVNVSGKYVLTRTAGMTTKTAGEILHFDQSTSHQVRFDAALEWGVNQTWFPRMGAGVSREFSGRMSGTVGNYTLPEKDIQGTTARFELGLKVKPQEHRNFYMDFDLQRCFGQKEGLAGMARMNWSL